MIIETDEHRELLKTELAVFKWADDLAMMNRHFTVKCGVIIVKNAQIICGNIASFRSSTYNKEDFFHPETTILDMYSSDLQDLSMYVVRLTMDNEPLASRPCVRCIKEIKAAPEITKLYYRNEKLRLVKEIL